MSKSHVVELGRQLSSADRRWIHNAVNMCDPEVALKSSLLHLLERSHDSSLSDHLRTVLQGLDDEEIEFLCTDFERERRRSRREMLRSKGRKP
jgi:hypothetical protein